MNVERICELYFLIAGTCVCVPTAHGFRHHLQCSSIDFRIMYIVYGAYLQAIAFLLAAISYYFPYYNISQYRHVTFISHIISVDSYNMI